MRKDYRHREEGNWGILLTRLTVSSLVLHCASKESCHCEDTALDAGDVGRIDLHFVRNDALFLVMLNSFQHLI